MSNQSIAIVQIVATVVVTIANVILTVLTYRYVRLTAGMLDHIRSSQAASVVIDLIFQDHSGYLSIFNTGTTPAKNIFFERLDGVEWSQHNGLSELREHGVSYLPAGRTLKFWLGAPDWDQVKKDHLVASITVIYDTDGSRQRREFVIDMTQYLGSAPDAAPADRIAEAIDGLRDAQRDRGRLSGLFRPAKKACIECAESIPNAAKVCSRCGARQIASPVAASDGSAASLTLQTVKRVHESETDSSE